MTEGHCKERHFEVNGKMKTLGEIAFMLGMNRSTLASRLWRTGSIELAMREGNHYRFGARKPATYMFGGKLCTVAEIATSSGYSKRTIYYRIAKLDIQPGDDLSCHFKARSVISTHTRRNRFVRLRPVCGEDVTHEA